MYAFDTYIPCKATQSIQVLSFIIRAFEAIRLINILFTRLTISKAKNSVFQYILFSRSQKYVSSRGRVVFKASD